jgi:hypothetical protein
VDDWLAEQGELDWVNDLRDGHAPLGPEPPEREPRPRPRPVRPAEVDAATIALRRRIVALAGLGLLIVAVVVIVIVASGGGSSPAVTPTVSGTTLPAVTPTTTTAPTTTAPTTTAPTTGQTPEPTEPSVRVTLPAGGNLSTGDSGAAVVALQKALAALGYDPGTPDGDFGPKTEAAVIEFQKAKGLTPDGIVGVKTAPALNEALASATP